MGHHLLLVPCPLLGHMNPMLHLAKLLHTKGFIITILMFTRDLIDTCHYPEFFFQSIDGISQELSSRNSFGDDVLRYLNELNEKCEKPFKDYLLSKLIMQSSGSSLATVCCIIYDAVMYFSAAVADEFEIPRIVLRTSSASTFLALSLGLNQKDAVITKEFPILRDKDKPVFASNDNISNNVLSRIHHGTKTASAVIWNSLHCLESTMFKIVKDKISSPIFPICPSLHHKQKYSSLFESSQSEDQSCISWLETKTSKSVLYVSTGSLVRVTKSELLEMAWGLANSGQSFLWVVRSGLVDNPISELEVLPKGFMEVTRKRGKVVHWAPQKKVLGHRSIGGFWTHNGWNSTVESVSEGVPMICWPRVGDQRVNARVVSHVWKVGIELEEKFGRWEVERAIRRVMVDEEGSGIRMRAIELKEKVRVSLEQGGSSFDHLGKLADFMRNSRDSK